MDTETARIYSEHAAEWERRRGAEHVDEARTLGARVEPGGVRVDLGCGPGLHLEALGEPVVGVDVVLPMLELARARVPDALLMVADLEALPIRSGALGGAWAAKSYLHLRRSSVPYALAELHRSCGVGSPVTLIMRIGTEEGPDTRSEFPGRLIADWEPARLRDVVEGAGFDVESVALEGRWARLRARRMRSLPDFVGPDMTLLVCGLNPSEYAADAGVGFARPGNRFWPAAAAAGLVRVDRDPICAFREGLGMTDLVKRATSRADRLHSAEYERGLERVERLVRWLEPGGVCFVGLAGWRTVVNRSAHAGPIPGGFAGRPAYLMPSTSGANASSTLDDLTEHLREAVTLASAQRERSSLAAPSRQESSPARFSSVSRQSW